jgi:tetratricopeptide (TPR) repeat protein
MSQQMTADQAIDQVHKLLRRGDTITAFRLSTQIVRQAPGFAAGLLAHARVLTHAGRGNQARMILTRVEPAMPDDQKASVRLDLARAWLCDGHAAEALEITGPLAEANPTDPAIAATHARALAGSGRPADGAQAARKAIDGGQDTIDLATALGVCALEGSSDQADPARASLAAHTATVGADVASLRDALAVLAELAARAGDDDAAFAAYRRAAKLQNTRLDPAKHAEGVKKFNDGWPADAYAKAPRLEGADTADDGLVFVVGLSGGGLGAVSAVARAVGFHAPAEPDASVVATMAELKTEMASFMVYVPRPAALTEPKLKAFRKDLLRRERGENASDNARIVDASFPNAYTLSVLPLAFPNARIVYIDRPLADAATASYFIERGPQTPFSGDPVVAGAVLRDVQGMLEHHWAMVEADEHARTLRLSYDALVGDADDARRELLGFIGIEADDSALAAARDAARKHASTVAHAPGVGDRFAGKLRDLHRAIED